MTAMVAYQGDANPIRQDSVNEVIRESLQIGAMHQPPPVQRAGDTRLSPFPGRLDSAVKLFVAERLYLTGFDFSITTLGFFDLCGFGHFVALWR
jgi:hypothetical protein